jgi:HEAT repeat protein
MSVGELKAELGSATGSRLRKVADELSERKGDEALDALAKGTTASYGAEARRAARAALEKSLEKQPPATIKKKLKDRQAEVRAAAAKAVGAKKLRLGSELIELLQDEYDDVRQAARASLVRLADKKVDFGPAPRSKKEAWAEAAKKWQEWWEKQ